jgi:phosphoenolpyruvate carboxykinase (GTP)
MRVQFEFFGSPDFSDEGRPILAGLNYFLTDEARGGASSQLLGEKRDVKVWLGWLGRRAHGEVDAISTPIGYIPRYEDLERLFAEVIDKEYPRELYDKQFSIYVDKILGRIELQREAFGKEKNLPAKLFEVYDEWQRDLEALKERYGAIITPDKLEAASA